MESGERAVSLLFSAAQRVLASDGGRKRERGHENIDQEEKIVNAIVAASVVSFCVVGVVWDLKASPFKLPWRYRLLRTSNWLLMGIAYAFQVMARYTLYAMNTTSSLSFLGLSTQSYGAVATVGLLAYAAGMLVNGVVIDRLGAQSTFCASLLLHSLLLLLMGLLTQHLSSSSISYLIFPLFGLNCYLQTFGALCPMKVNAAWYPAEERGRIGGIFGLMLGVGYMLAFGANGVLVQRFHVWSVFYIISVALFGSFVLCVGFLQDSVPEEYEDLRRSPPKRHPEADEREGAGREEEKPLLGATAGEKGEAKASSDLTITDALKSVDFILSGVLMFSVGAVREGFFAWIVPYLESSFSLLPGSLPQEAVAASITVGAVVGAALSGWGCSYFASNRAFFSLLVYVSLSVVFLLFLLLPQSVPTTIAVALAASVGFFCIQGLRRVLCVDFGGTEFAATAAGLLGTFQFVGGAVGGAGYGSLIAKGGFGWWQASQLFFALVGVIFSTWLTLRWKRQKREEREAEMGEELNV